MRDDLQRIFKNLSPEKQALVLKKLQAQCVATASDGMAEDIIPPMPKDRDIPLSLTQERLWFLSQLEGQNLSYSEFTPLELKGALNLAALRRALTEIVRRHAPLRTVFAVKAGQPMQVIQAPVPVPLPVTDLSAWPAGERERQLQTLFGEAAQCPMDLSQGPLLRASLVRLGLEHHLLLLGIHHIAMDGWSIAAVFFHELTALYQAFLYAKPSPLPDLPLQYADFAWWQRQWLQGDECKRQLDYWRQQLAGLPPLLELPTDRPRSATQTSQGDVVFFSLPDGLARRLQRLSQNADATLFMTLLAAFGLLLSRYSGQNDIAVGTPIANRQKPEIEPLIGFFANTLVFRVDLSGQPSFAELLQRVGRMTRDAYQNQDLPFGEVVKALAPIRDLSHHPLFQVMFAYQNIQTRLNAVPGLSIIPIEYRLAIAKFDLTLQIMEEQSRLSCELEYNSDLFDRATIERMAGQFIVLLEAIAHNSGQSIIHLPLVTAAEHRKLVFEWNDNQVLYPEDTRVHRVFERQAKQTPDKIAIVCPLDKILGQGEVQARLSYRELNTLSEQMAARLRALGVGLETPVGICLERSVMVMAAILGILKVGGAYVPLDPDYPPERLAWLLNDSQVELLITQRRLIEKLPETSARLLFLDGGAGDPEKAPEARPSCTAAAEAAAYIIYTSGSTGKPKGVVGTQGNLAHAYHIWQDTYRLDGSYTILQMANFSFSVFIADWVRALCFGGKLVLTPAEWVIDPERLYRLMREERVDCADFVPAVLRQLVQYLAESEQSLDFMRLLIVGSDRWHTQEYNLIRKLAGPNTRLINAYGMTETTVDSSYFEPGAVDLPGNRLMPIGRPFPNTLVYILDPHMQPVPIGIAGQLYIGGAGLAKGYLNQPALTQERFLDNPFGADRIYKTGELARYLPDGTIEFLGRSDSQVKLRGFRIEPGEIEAILAQHPDLREALIIVREDIPGNPQLVGYLVANRPAPEQDNHNLLRSLRAHLAARLPQYMIPSVFVLLDSLPLTPNGKVDRGNLPVPDTAKRGGAREPSYRDQASPLKQQLAQVWQDILGIDCVDAEDNFFELGGHSLLATRLLSRIEEELGHALSVPALYQNPTIAQLALAIEAAAPDNLADTPYSPLVAVRSKGARKPFFCVPGIDGNVLSLYPLAHELGAEQPFYGLQPAGLDGTMPPCFSIEEMAHGYLGAIRKRQAKGPYYLGGYSFGGMVAFEMARLLLEQEETVAPLVLLDSYAPGSFLENTSAWDETQWLLAFIEQIEQVANRPLGISDSDLRSVNPAEQLAWLKRCLRQAGLPPDFAREDRLDGAMRVFRANMAMSYLPREPAPIGIALFRAREGQEAMADNRPESRLGWQALTSKPVKVHFVPGNHFTLLTPPHVKSLAQLVLECLQT
jgi:amino acid adenylation domain-containing protein